MIAYKSFDSFTHDTSFPAWVNTIARNLVWNDRRKTSRRFKLLNEKISDLLTEQDPSHKMAVEEDTDLRRNALRSCLNKIPERSREILKIRYQQEMEPSEIATKLDLPASTLRTQLMRIRETLRKCISKHLLGGSS